MTRKVWGEIIYRFPNFNGCIVVVWELISYFSPRFVMEIIIHAGVINQHHWFCYSLSHVPRQPIIWTSAGILLIGPLGRNFIEILIKIQQFSYKNMNFKISSAKRWPFCIDHHGLTQSVAATLRSIETGMSSFWRNLTHCLHQSMLE